MLTEQKIKELVRYWLVSAESDRLDMESLYKGKRYSACLFFGHLILEKALKAMVVTRLKEPSPKIHNLPRLAEMAKLDLDPPEKALLFEVDSFNMETRYPDERLDFHKKCDKAYTDRFYKSIINLYKKLCQRAN